jgi:hypothetical protein
VKANSLVAAWGIFSLLPSAKRDFNSIEKYTRHGTEITVIHRETFSPEEELVRDLIAIVTVFSTRLQGLRSHKNPDPGSGSGKGHHG